MPMNFETTHEYYMDVTNFFYCNEHDCLWLTDKDDNRLMINGIKNEPLVRLMRNLICSKQPIMDKLKTTDKEEIEQLHEIYDSLGKYLKPSKSTKSIKDA